MILIASMSVISSCEDDNNVQRKTISLFGGGIEGYELFEEFDSPNLIGVVDFTTVNSDLYHFAFDGTPEYTHYQATSFDITADFINADKTEFFSLGEVDLYANGFKLYEHSVGQYYVPTASGNIVNYFGGGYNTVQFDSNVFFNTLADSVTFGSPINLTNVSVGDIVSRSENFVINLTGASSTSILEWELHHIRSEFNQFDTVHISGLALNVIPYTSSFTINTNTLGMLKSGFYDLIVTAHEPKYITTSNGKEICLLGRSVYATTIQIVD